MSLKKWFQNLFYQKHMNAQNDRIENHYVEIKTKLEHIQRSIDPISRLLLDMEFYFKTQNKKKKARNGTSQFR